MVKRGVKPKFTNVSCPNQGYKFYGISGKENMIGKCTYHLQGSKMNVKEEPGNIREKSLDHALLTANDFNLRYSRF